MDKISLNSVVSRKTEVCTSEVDTETVMLDIETGNYACLSRVAGHIWKLIENPVTVGELIGRLLQQYDIEEAVCEKEVLSLFCTMYENKLIILHNS